MNAKGKKKNKKNKLMLKSKVYIKKNNKRKIKQKKSIKSTE